MKKFNCMDATDIFVGVGIGAIIAYALYRYFSAKTPPVPGSNNGSDVSNNDNIENVNTISYDMIISWLKNEHQSFKFVKGDKLFILQDSVARESFVQAYPNYKMEDKASSILCVGIIRDNEVITSKFFIYNVMAQSLIDILPKDTTKSFVQEISD